MFYSYFNLYSYHLYCLCFWGNCTKKILKALMFSMVNTSLN